MQYILFDLDGTLTDSGPGIVNAIQYALNQLGMAEEDKTVLYRNFIGPPLTVSFPKMYGFSKEKTAEAIAMFHEYYDQRGIYENQPYPGIPELLAELKEKGKQVALATSKPLNLAERVLRHFDLWQYFDQVCGGTLDESRNAKKDVIEDALNALSVPDGSQAVMVGDRYLDVVGAHANGLTCIGILYGGYETREEMEEAQADFIAADVAELRELLLR